MAERHRDPAGTTIGLLTFLGGVALIVTTFFLARDMFAKPPEVALGIKPGETLDTNKMMQLAVGVLLKVLLLLVMSGIGSILSSRGIRLYMHGANPVEKGGKEEGP